MTAQPRSRHVHRPDLRLLAYNAALTLGFPALMGYALRRLLSRSKARGGWRQRLGFYPRLPGGQERIWVHAVSAGEMQAAAPVCAALSQALPGCRIVVTTTTPAGKKVAVSRIPQAEAVLYFPLDFWPCVNRALDAIRPRACALMEKELWPNFLTAARARNIPVAVLSARISPRSMRRSRPVRGFLKWVMGMVHLFAAQTERDAILLRYLGCPEGSIAVCGNVKFDQRLDPLSAQERGQLRALLGIAPDEHVIVAGSTHPAEEQTLLDALALMKGAGVSARLVVAPRHIERAPQVEALVSRAGLRALRRTAADGRQTPRDTVVILDTMGELARIYGIGDVAFVGGTLVPIGGHDLLQPVAHGLPVFFGAHTFNLPEVAAALLEAGLGFRAPDALRLADGMGSLLRSPSHREQLAAAARSFMDTHRGASQRCALALKRLVDRGPA